MALVRRPVQPNPARLLHAIASIGYDPEVALCDIIDNCLDAKASQVDVQLVQEIHEDEGETDSISQYIIADNGTGMDEAALENAFKIGSDREYTSHSLGKFGIGLKSAALSLGDRIAVVTKRADAEKPICAILSASLVEETNEYVIDIGEPPEDLTNLWRRYAPNADRGTLVAIGELNDSQPPFSRFLEYIRRFCSITYHLFIEDSTAPLAMSVNGQALKPTDPLFTKEAEANGPLNPLTWSGREPHILLKPASLALAPGITATVEATHLVHPPSFEAEGKRNEMRDRFAIDQDPYTGSPRHGFYVYRNRRVIVMAERFRGLVSSQQAAWAFRGRLMFDEAADKVVSLDVKKRHCQLPKKSRTNLGALIRTYQAASAEAWKEAGRREEKRKGDTRQNIATESLLSGPVTNLTYAPGTELTDQSAITARQEAQSKIEEATLAAIQDRNLTKEHLQKLLEDKNPVILAEGLKANVMWLPLPAVEAGFAQTLVNQMNTWVMTAYASADQDPSLYVVLHQFFTILARAEIEVRSNSWSNMPQDAAERVLEMFRRKAANIAEDLAQPLEDMLRRISEGRIEDE